MHENISWTRLNLPLGEGVWGGEKKELGCVQKGVKFAKTDTKKAKIHPRKRQLLKNKATVNQCIENYFWRKRCYVTKKS